MLPPNQPEGSSPTLQVPAVPPSHVDDRKPLPGELAIREKLSWKTWQLLVAMLVAGLGGMAVDYYLAGGDASGSTGSTGSAGSYTLPPPGSSGTTTTAGSTGSGGTTTTTGGSTTTTTTSAATGTTTTDATTATTAVAQVLLGPTQSHGNWTSTPFSTTTPGWDIGWAYQCPSAPASGSSLEIFVTTPGGSPTGSPAVLETGASGQSVTSVSTTGQQVLVVEAPANCEWVVKVSGS
jgi:hypothetical protein